MARDTAKMKSVLVEVTFRYRIKADDPKAFREALAEAKRGEWEETWTGSYEVKRLRTGVKAVIVPE